LAYYDVLTGLPNRVLYNDRLSLALAHAQRTREMLVVLFLDMDRFKDINDTLGHSAGDQLLKTVARRMADSLRKEDTITRLGGDEFTLLLPGMTQAEDIAEIAQKILEAVRKPLMLGSHEVNITASIGIAIYAADGEDAVALLKNADTAMYHAKEQGRNNYQFFTPALHIKTVEQLEMESSLHHAQEREEFIVYYQPLVDIKTGRIVSSEALLRWQHPERGLINPAEFISMTERTGLIVPIGEWVLRTACAQNKAWQDAGLPLLLVAVNLSARQFQQENLVEMVVLALKETGMDPRFLVLEVTESTAMYNIESAAYKMERLNRLGVHLAIDDLGTGYSSLSYLKTFPIHALKIDRSFMQNVVTDSNDAAIVTAIISMGKGLGLKVVAEGVETTAQLEFLRSLGCDEAQGYLFDKPMAAGEFKKMLEQDKRLGV
jgi:diguanylate cyclase (GGDEF)-like protein